MPRRPQKNPRRIASQERSRFTVDALLEATARVLAKEGFERTSTNKIAAAAGVSIGSLYQYYPSKEALVGALIERHTREMSRVVREALLRVAGCPFDVAVREFVVAAIDAHGVDPKLHRILTEEIPRTGQLANIEAVEREACAVLREYFEAHRGEIEARDSDLAAFIFVTTVEALTHSAVLNRPDVLAGEKAEEFTDEVTRLALRYLRTSSPPPGRRSGVPG
jgi:AcrR family transcriptional regulator